MIQEHPVVICHQKLLHFVNYSLNPEILHLELADGSKVQSTQKAENVNVSVGKSICRVDFTVTKLLKDVDLVLRSELVISLESCHQLERAAYAYLDRKRMEQGPGNSVTFRKTTLVL